MFYFKYKLYDGTIPTDAIKTVISDLNRGEYRMGQFRQLIDANYWLLGQINISDSNTKSAIIAACSNWELTELSAQDAINFAINAGPAEDTVLQPKLTMGSTIIDNNGYVLRQVIES